MEERDDYPIIPQTEAKKVDFSEYLKLYGTYAEHDRKLHAALEELASLKEENALLKECFDLAEKAKNNLRNKGYGWTGLDILKTCELVEPFSDNS